MSSDQFQCHRYVLKTTVIDPHNAAPIRQMILNGRGSFLATLSDGDFKLWMIIKQKTLTGKRFSGKCCNTISGIYLCCNRH